MMRVFTMRGFGSEASRLFFIGITYYFIFNKKALMRNILSYKTYKEKALQTCLTADHKNLPTNLLKKDSNNKAHGSY